MLNSRALFLATAVGTALQVIMVILGHSNNTVLNLFAVGGMGFSLIAGIAYAKLARVGTYRSLAIGGMVAGASCGFIGIFISFALGDVPASLLVIGTLSSDVAGGIGGLLGKLLTRNLVASPSPDARD